MKPFLLACSAILLPYLLTAQSAVGIWKTIDDKSGEAQSHIEVYEKNGKLYGKIVKTLDPTAETRCSTCTGSRANQPYLGMEIISEAVPDGAAEWEGKIYDPDSDTSYKLVMWVEKNAPNKLHVRGKHWTGLYRTQTWERVK